MQVISEEVLENMRCAMGGNRESKMFFPGPADPMRKRRQ